MSYCTGEAGKVANEVGAVSIRSVVCMADLIVMISVCVTFCYCCC